MHIYAWCKNSCTLKGGTRTFEIRQNIFQGLDAGGKRDQVACMLSSTNTAEAGIQQEISLLRGAGKVWLRFPGSARKEQNQRMKKAKESIQKNARDCQPRSPFLTKKTQ